MICQREAQPPPESATGNVQSSHSLAHSVCSLNVSELCFAHCCSFLLFVTATATCELEKNFSCSKWVTLQRGGGPKQHQTCRPGAAPVLPIHTKHTSSTRLPCRALIILNQTLPHKTGAEKLNNSCFLISVLPHSLTSSLILLQQQAAHQNSLLATLASSWKASGARRRSIPPPPYTFHCLQD